MCCFKMAYLDFLLHGLLLFAFTRIHFVRMIYTVDLSLFCLRFGWFILYRDAFLNLSKGAI